ncbi:MAG: DUF2335 domain-containing protein [Candidatus Cloacimonetes bacterium]|nr:DUF2335 domain-containing protein [Candidatus Cloacimonadota bacterium]
MTKNKKQTRSITALQQFKGPIPPPKILQQYDSILPGAADRILTMAEKQSDHRQSLEKKHVNSSLTDARIGLWLGFSIVVISLFIAGFLLYNNKTTSGLILGGGSLITLAGIFVYGTRIKRT